MDIETTFDLLSSSVRRNIVATLHESGPITRPELTAALADKEDDDADASADAQRRMRIALHHNHLPRLADAGVIEYDDDTVTATPQLEVLARSLAAADGEPSAALI